MREPTTDKDLSVTDSGVLAASLLEHACSSAIESDDSLQLEVVRDLARDLKHFFGETSLPDSQGTLRSDLLTETALRCADLANLAACNVSALPSEHQPRAIACVHLSAGTVKALDALAESAGPETPNAENILRDLRSAGWRADLAVRQVKEFEDSS